MNTDVAQPTTNQYGDEVHPAFGQIRVSRISYGGGGAVLFDSDVKHGQTVRITVETASRKRDNNQDWIHGERQLMEVELSEAQWAAFVSSFNTSGVPATLRWTKENGQLPALPFAPRLAHSTAEVKGAAERLMANAKAAMAEYEQAIEDKAGAKVIKEKRRALHFALANSESNMSFAAESLNEHAENVVQKARADIEAVVVQKATQLGLPASDAKLLELPSLSEKPGPQELTS